MFADALLDSGRGDRSRRGWATLTSFALQALAVTCLLVLPLLYPQVLPQVISAVRMLTVPQGPEPLPRSETQARQVGSGPQSNTQGTVWRVPAQIPRGISSAPDTDAPAIPFAATGPDSSSDGIDPRNLVVGSTGRDNGPFIPQPPAPRVIRVSRIMEGSLIHRVEPPYPALARAAGIQGPVELAAVVGRDGRIENLQVLSGHPLLVAAARDAVKQWRYRPYLLNGEPVEVDTRITVNFIISR